MEGALLKCVRALLVRMGMALSDPRPRDKVVGLGLGMLCGDVLKTVTSALEWERSEGDWRSRYRLL